MYKGEKINSISHLVGASLALAGWVVLIVFASFTGDVYKIVSAIVYGLCLFLMFLFSTLYHSCRGGPKKVFQVFDHVAIFLLIAGTYTPYCLVTLRDTSGWLIFGLVWGLAAIGITFKSVFGDRWNLVSTLFYLVCGWTIAIDIPGVRDALPAAGFAWLVAGGVIYSLGAFFFLYDRIPRNHEIWHFFILAAAGAHYVSILFYVI